MAVVFELDVSTQTRVIISNFNLTMSIPSHSGNFKEKHAHDMNLYFITNVLVNTMTNTYHTFPPSIMFLVTNPAKFSETVSCNTYAQVYGMSHPHWLIHMLSHSQTDTLHTAAWSVR